MAVFRTDFALLQTGMDGIAVETLPQNNRGRGLLGCIVALNIYAERYIEQFAERLWSWREHSEKLVTTHRYTTPPRRVNPLVRHLADRNYCPFRLEQGWDRRFALHFNSGENHIQVSSIWQNHSTAPRRKFMESTIISTNVLFYFGIIHIFTPPLLHNPPKRAKLQSSPPHLRVSFLETRK